MLTQYFCRTKLKVNGATAAIAANLIKSLIYFYPGDRIKWLTLVSEFEV